MGLVTSLARRAGGRTVDRVVDEVAPQLANGIRKAVDSAVDLRGSAAAAAADEFRREHAALVGAELDRALIRHAGRRSAAISAASAVPGVVPGIGTAVEVATVVAGEAAILHEETMLILELLHLHGRDLADRDARRADVLLVLALEAEVARRKGDRLLVGDDEIPLRGADGSAISDAALAQVSREMGERIAGRIARRRASGLTARFLPLGVGVVVAAVGGHKVLARVGKATRAYLDLVDGDGIV